MSALFPTRGVPGAGGGSDAHWRVPAVRRASADQVKGLFPWVAGTGSKLGTGAPLGPVLRRTPGPAAILCADPISWFERGGLISNPSAVVMGGPGHGKSTLIRRMITFHSYQGGLGWVLGDVKAEYVRLISGIGGQVISLGRGRGSLNPLDLSEASTAAAYLRSAGHHAQADALLAEARARRQLGVEALVTVQRGTAPGELECLVLTAALGVLDARWRRRKGAPVLGHLLGVVDEGPAELHEAALSRGSTDRYYAATDSLRTSLAGLSSDNGLGGVFNRATTAPLDRHRSVVFDVSGIDKGERKLRAAALLSCWAAGFGAIAVSNAMQDAGLEPGQRKLLVTDELWSVLQEGTGLVDRYNGLSRLNRTDGVGTITAFHSSADLAALESEADRSKAGGLIERAGMLFCAAMPRAEIGRLQGVTHFTHREADEVASWSTPPTLQTTNTARGVPPGRGNFLLKAGDGSDTPGVAFNLRLTPSELGGLNNTDTRWDVA